MCKVKDLQHKFQLVYPYYINYIYQHRCLHGGRYCLFGKIVIFSFFFIAEVVACIEVTTLYVL